MLAEQRAVLERGRGGNSLPEKFRVREKPPGQKGRGNMKRREKKMSTSKKLEGSGFLS